ncbi:MAG: MinD/ParA family ATP-binding protein [Micrococcaceae bacterium]
MITISLDDQGQGIVTLPTRTVQIYGEGLADGRNQAIGVVATYAREIGGPASAAADNARLVIHPDGRVHEEPDSATPTPKQPIEDTQTLPAVPTPEAAPVPPRPHQSPVEAQPFPTSDDPTLLLGPAPTTVQHPQRPATTPPRSGSFVRESTPAPTQGMQSVVYKMTGGLWNLGPGQREQYKDELHQRAAKQITGTRNVTFMCLKGGISKTSTTLGVGLTLAEHRPDSVLAIDANPDAGDLADRALSHEQVEAVSPRTITDLVHAIEANQIHNLTDLNRFTQTSGRLHLIAGEQDPDVSESLTAEEYISVRDVSDRFYPITLTDCGTGVTHPAMKGILENAQQLVVASGWAVTGAKRAERTLTWLHQAHNGAYAELARNAVVVLTDTGTTSKAIDRDQIMETLGALCRAVHIVPFDPAVAKGDLVRLPDLTPQTRQAYLEVGATIIDAL